MSVLQLDSRYRLFVGIDVAATTVTATWQQVGHPSVAPQTVEQMPAGFASLLKRLQKTGVPAGHTFVCLEATGSYWIALATTLHHHGYCVSVVNPTHPHHFAKSHGRRSKTDPVDASLLLRVAIERQPALWTPPPQVYVQLWQRLVAHDALVRMRTQALNHQHALGQWPLVVESVSEQFSRTVEALTEQIATLEREIAQVLSESAWQESARLLQSIPGVGLMTAAWLLVCTLNFTISSTPEALVAYAGLAPMLRESGTSIRGRPYIGHGGNARLRHAVSMATLSGTRCNPLLKRHYDRLRAAGKAPKSPAVLQHASCSISRGQL